jgi:hypothetical protein
MWHIKEDDLGEYFDVWVLQRSPKWGDAGLWLWKWSTACCCAAKTASVRVLRFSNMSVEAA